MQEGHVHCPYTCGAIISCMEDADVSTHLPTLREYSRHCKSLDVVIRNGCIEAATLLVTLLGVRPLPSTYRALLHADQRMFAFFMCHFGDERAETSRLFDVMVREHNILRILNRPLVNPRLLQNGLILLRHGACRPADEDEMELAPEWQDTLESIARSKRAALTLLGLRRFRRNSTLLLMRVPLELVRDCMARHVWHTRMDTEVWLNASMHLRKRRTLSNERAPV